MAWHSVAASDSLRDMREIDNYDRDCRVVLRREPSEMDPGCGKGKEHRRKFERFLDRQTRKVRP